MLGQPPPDPPPILVLLDDGAVADGGHERCDEPGVVIDLVADGAFDGDVGVVLRQDDAFVRLEVY